MYTEDDMRTTDTFSGPATLPILGPLARVVDGRFKLVCRLKVSKSEVTDPHRGRAVGVRENSDQGEVSIRGLGDVPSCAKLMQKSSSQRTLPRGRDRARAIVR